MVKTQHVQIPESVYKRNKPSLSEVMVYGCIKSYMNKDSRKAYPTLDQISQVTKLSKPNIIKSIDSLEKSNDLEVIRYDENNVKRRNNVYKFNPTSERFEMFSFEFIKELDLAPMEKAILMYIQPYFFKHEGKAYTIYSASELSLKTGIPKQTMSKYIKIFKEKEIISDSYRKFSKEFEKTINRKTMDLDLEKINQFELFVASKIFEYEDNFKLQNQHNEILYNKIVELQKEVKRLKTLYKKENEINSLIEFPM